MAIDNYNQTMVEFDPTNYGCGCGHASCKCRVPPSVLFVVEDNERNIIDQKIIEADLYKRFKITSMRCTFDEIGRYGKID